MSFSNAARKFKLVTQTPTLRNRQLAISHERYGRSIVAEKPAGCAVVRVSNRMNCPLRNIDFIAGLYHEVLTGNRHFEPTFCHCYELVGLVDEVVPFLAGWIDERSTVVATGSPVACDYATNYRPRKFTARHGMVHGQFTAVLLGLPSCILSKILAAGETSKTLAWRRSNLSTDSVLVTTRCPVPDWLMFRNAFPTRNCVRAGFF